MSLKQQIDEGIKAAMKAKSVDELRTLRSIKSLILLAETEKGAKEDLSAEREMQLLTKAAKQRKESALIFKEQDRADLHDNEMLEFAIIQKFLPQQLSTEEITEVIKGIVAKVGASSMKDMGKVMGMASKEMAGKADGKIISGIVKELLS